MFIFLGHFISIRFHWFILFILVGKWNSSSNWARTMLLRYVNYNFNNAGTLFKQSNQRYIAFRRSDECEAAFTWIMPIHWSEWIESECTITESARFKSHIRSITKPFRCCIQSNSGPFTRAQRYGWRESRFGWHWTHPTYWPGYNEVNQIVNWCVYSKQGRFLDDIQSIWNYFFRSILSIQFRNQSKISYGKEVSSLGIVDFIGESHLELGGISSTWICWNTTKSKRRTCKVRTNSLKWWSTIMMNQWLIGWIIYFLDAVKFFSIYSIHMLIIKRCEPLFGRYKFCYWFYHR